MNGSGFHTLYLRVSPQNLAFACNTQKPDAPFSFRLWPMQPTASQAINIRTILREEPLAQNHPKRIRVLVQGPSTLVPLNDFQEEHCETIYSYTISDSLNTRVFYDTLPTLNAVLLFGLHETVCHEIEEHFGNVFYSSTSTSVITHFSEKSRLAAGNKIYVYLHEKKIEVMAFKDSSLCLFNTFPVYATVDAVYYILFIFKQLGWDAKTDELYLACETYQKDELFKEMGKYIHNVCPVIPTAEYNRHPLTRLKDIPYDLITNLLQTY